MKLPNNDKVVDNSETPDRRSPMGQRVLAFALIALPYILIIFGVLAGILVEPGASNIIYGPGGYLPAVIVMVFLALSYSLFKNNPRLRRASMMTLRPYAQSVMGLDEREKQVIDQAFRNSYRIIALTCLLTLVCAVINVQTLRLTYHPGTTSLLYIVLGAFGLLTYLPMAIVAWTEDI